jgi:hypothetical protein
VRWAQQWGLYVTNQTAFALHGVSTDGCNQLHLPGVGGMLCVSAHGTYVSPSAESNPVGMKFFDCRAVVTGANLRDNEVPVVLDGASRAVWLPPL